MFNSIEDRALSEHRGSALLIKKASGKYSIFLPLTGTGENGSTPDQLEKTAIGNKQKSYVEGRQDNPQKNIPFYSHRDNIRAIEKVQGETQDFIRLLPDFTGMKFSGKVSYMLNNTDVGNLEQGQLTITPETSDEFVDNCYDLVEDTVIFKNAIPEKIYINGKGTKEINLTTEPADATINASSETPSIATATVSEGKLTITGVANGSAIIKITASKAGYASFDRTILVIVDGVTA